ncbi:MAG: hypothetical protein AABZ60_02270 [Planctomycetota bacterium]
MNAKKQGFKVREAPISLTYNWGNKSNVSMLAIKGIFVDTLAIAYRLYIKRYYDKKHSMPLDQRYDQKDATIEKDSFRIIESSDPIST